MSSPKADLPMGDITPVGGDPVDPGGDELAVGKVDVLRNVFLGRSSTSAGDRGRVGGAVARGSNTELYGGLSSASPSVSPGVIKAWNPDSPMGGTTGAAAAAETGELHSIDTLSDDAAASSPDRLGEESLRPSTNLPPNTAPQHQEVMSDARSHPPPARDGDGSGGGDSVAVTAGAQGAGAAANLPPAGSGGVAEVGSTAAAIATVTRSIERERQQQGADVGPGSEQEAPVPEPRHGRRGSGGGISSWRNTWQGAVQRGVSVFMNQLLLFRMSSSSGGVAGSMSLGSVCVNPFFVFVSCVRRASIAVCFAEAECSVGRASLLSYFFYPVVWGPEQLAYWPASAVTQRDMPCRYIACRVDDLAIEESYGAVVAVDRGAAKSAT